MTSRARRGLRPQTIRGGVRLGRSVADAVPGVAPVRELTGLAAYRAERWSMAKIHLRSHFAITGDPEHLPLVMDCERAGHRYRAVEKTFGELEASEPTAEVLVEGRIVMAGAWADQERYEDAIQLLTKAGATKQLRNLRIDTFDSGTRWQISLTGLATPCRLETLRAQWYSPSPKPTTPSSLAELVSKRTAQESQAPRGRPCPTKKFD